MTEKPNLQSQLKKALDQSTEDLPDFVQQKLAHARKQALEAQIAKGSVVRFPGKWTRELVAVAACVTLVVPVWFGLKPSTSDSVFQPQGLELMVSFAELDDEEWELVDDLEFALWLSEQNQLEAET